MRINTNLGALTAATNLTKVNDAVRSSAEKLSSGFRINKASDDAAGLGVANLFRSDIRALTQAQRNAEQATSVYAIAEGGATSIEKILERMKELAAQSASDSVDSGGRTRIQAEYDGLLKEIDRVTLTTEFQGSKLLAGTYGTSSAATALAVNMTSFSTSGKVGDYTFAKGAAGRVIASFTDAAGVVQTENVAFAATTKFANLGLTVQWNIVGAFAGTITLTRTFCRLPR
ncbi:MAG: flagellin [Gemmatimonadetes bacterium]|nr:flagellin [Gemmatimonadota bacterium]